MSRLLLILIFAVALPALGRAQEQEQRLVDRLLRPDTALQNTDQNKKFVADSSASLKTRSTSTRAFYTGTKPILREAGGLKAFSTREAVTTAYVEQNRPAALPDGSELSKKASLATRNTVAIPPARESNKKMDATDFADQKKFRGQGKSQKALDQKNATLTIEQVRELLNKNK